jgi:hypothetical protein
MKNLFLLLVLIVPDLIFAQTVTVSEPISIRNDQSYEVLGKMKDRFLLFRDKANNEYEIQAFNENLHQSWTKEIEFEKKRTEILGLIPNTEYFNIIYRFKIKGKTILKCNKYDAGANEIDSATIVNYGSRFYPPEVSIIHSEDKSKILLYSIERQSKIEAFCFDLEEMELLWKNEFSPEDMTFHADFYQPLLTNNGEMYFILGKDNRKSTKEKHLYEIYFVDAETPNGNVSFFDVSMNEMMTFDLLFEYDNLNNNIVAGGLYSDKNRGKAIGHFFLKIPSNNTEAYLLTFKPFEDKLVSDFLGKLVKDNKGIPEIVVKEIILRRDGGIILIAESNKLLERATTNMSRGGFVGDDGRGYIVDYHYEDMMVISIHPDGETHWETILPKRQYSQDDSAIYSSFFLLKTPSALRLLFNDEIKYENTVSEYVIRGNGEFDRNSVLSTFNQKIQLRFQDAVQIAANELLVPSERRSRLKLVKVAY